MASYLKEVYLNLLLDEKSKEKLKVCKVSSLDLSPRRRKAHKLKKIRAESESILKDSGLIVKGG